MRARYGAVCVFIVSRIENWMRKTATFWIHFAKGFAMSEKLGGMIHGKTWFEADAGREAADHR